MTPRPTRLWGALAAALVVGGFGCSPTAPPTTPSPSPAGPTLVAAELVGRVIDAELEKPIPGAQITTVPRVCYPGRPCGPSVQLASTVADENGMFRLTANVPEDWGDLRLGVVASGYEPTGVYVSRTSNRELRLLRTLTIRPGESIDMRVFSGSYVCGYESHLCRRVFIESSGGSIDLEVVPADTERDVGLFLDHPFSVTSFERRVTVSGGEVWIYAGRAELTDGRSGVLGIFEQRIRLIAHRPGG
jgi:hypothetical protein